MKVLCVLTPLDSSTFIEACMNILYGLVKSDLDHTHEHDILHNWVGHSFKWSGLEDLDLILIYIKMSTDRMGTISVL